MDQSTARTEATRPDVVRRPADGSRTGRNRDRSLIEIEEDIARTRVRLSGTIEALERELALDRVVEKSAQALRSALGPGPGPFRQQVRAYAIPLALIATGLSWLIMLRRRNYQAAVPSTVSETPAEAIAADETLVQASPLAEMAGPVEPVSLVDEKTGM